MGKDTDQAHAALVNMKRKCRKCNDTAGEKLFHEMAWAVKSPTKAGLLRLSEAAMDLSDDERFA